MCGKRGHEGVILPNRLVKAESELEKKGGISWYFTLKQSSSFFMVIDSFCIQELLSVSVIIVFYVSNLPDLTSGCPSILIYMSFRPVSIIL